MRNENENEKETKVVEQSVMITNFSKEWLKKKEAGSTRKETIFYTDNSGEIVGITFDVRIIPAVEKSFINEKSLKYTDGEPEVDMEEFQKQYVRHALDLTESEIDDLVNNKALGFWNNLIMAVYRVNGNVDQAKMDRAKN